METEIQAKPKLEVIRPDEILHILEAGEVGAVLDLVVTDKNGRVTDKRLLKSKSFVRQFLELLWCVMYQIPEIAPYSLRDTTNTLRNIIGGGFVFACNAGLGDTLFGIVVGTGAVAPTINDYQLGSKIAHGVGAGQLQYSAVTFGAPAWDTTTSQFTITRDFANASGAAITVNEIGLYVKGYIYTGAETYYYFMSIRDVIGGGISVPNGQTLTVNYRLQATI